MIKSDGDGEVLEMKNDSGAMLATVGVALQKPGTVSPTTATIGVMGTHPGPAVFLHSTNEAAVIRVDDQTGLRVWTASSKPGLTKDKRE